MSSTAVIAVALSPNKGRPSARRTVAQDLGIVDEADVVVIDGSVGDRK